MKLQKQVSSVHILEEVVFIIYWNKEINFMFY